MSENTHTPEPWDVRSGMVRANCDRTIDFGQFTVSTTKIPIAECIVRDGQTILNDAWQYNATRIVACVNACAGINPEAVQDLIAALQRFVSEAAVKLDEYGNRRQNLINVANAALRKAGVK